MSKNHTTQVAVLFLSFVLGASMGIGTAVAAGITDLDRDGIDDSIQPPIPAPVGLTAVSKSSQPAWRSSLYAQGAGMLFRVNLDTGEATLVAAMPIDSANSLGGWNGPELLHIPEWHTGEVHRVHAKTAQRVDTILMQGTTNDGVTGIAQVDTKLAYVIINGGYTSFGFDRDHLARLDLETGTYTLIGESTMTGLQSLALGPDGWLYAWDVSYELVRIDPSTAQTWDIDPVRPQEYTPVQALAFSPDGRLFGGRWDLYEIDPATGEPARIGPMLLDQQLDVRGLAFASVDQRFVPVEPTGLPLPVELHFNNFSLANGSEFGVFDLELCVGAVTGIEPMWRASFPVWERDLAHGLPGFRLFDPMTFRFYDASVDRFYEVVTRDSDSPPSFEYGPYFSASLWAVDRSVQISVPGNLYTLISFPGEPRYERWDQFPSWQFAAGTVVDDDGDLFVGWRGSGTLEEWIPTEAYRLFMVYDSELVIDGFSFQDAAVEYPVRAGRWNWIGHPYAVPTPASSALSTFASEIEILQSDRGGVWIPELGVDTLGDLEPGRGYMVLPTATTSLVFEPSAQPAAIKRSRESDPLATGLPFAIVVDLPAPAGELGWETIDIFDANTLVGSASLENEDLRQVVVAWQGDAANSLQGFVTGRTARFRAGLEAGEVLDLSSDAVIVFGSGSYAHVRVAAQAQPPSPPRLFVGQPYPNPFNPRVSLSYSLDTGARVQVQVFDLSGRKVAELLDARQPAGEHSIGWDGRDQERRPVASGGYFLELRVGEQRFVRHAVLVR